MTHEDLVAVFYKCRPVCGRVSHEPVYPGSLAASTSPSPQKLHDYGDERQIIYQCIELNIQWTAHLPKLGNGLLMSTYWRQYITIPYTTLLWRKALLLNYIGLPTPPPPPPLKKKKKKSTFIFSQTIDEIVFVSFEFEKMRMFLVQSIVRWYWVLVRSWGAVVSFPVWNHWPGKVWFQLAPVSWPSCSWHGHGRAASHFLLQILLLFQIPGHRCRIFESIKGPPF